MTLREPEPSSTHLTPLAQKLAARIAASGPISLYDYMAACLYDPEHGYYRRAPAIGRGGDFVTAPEISQYTANLSVYGPARHGGKWGNRRASASLSLVQGVERSWPMRCARFALHPAF